MSIHVQITGKRIEEIAESRQIFKRLEYCEGREEMSL